MLDEVRTDRLVGTRPLFRDADELHAVCDDPRLAEWIWPDGPPTLAQTRTALVRDAAHWKKHRFGRWLWREQGAIVAHAGLLATGDDGVELAWYVAPDRWREGIGSEVARAAVGVAFETVGLPALTAKTLPENVASRALMISLGMQPDGELEHVGLTHVRFRLTNSAS